MKLNLFLFIYLFTLTLFKTQSINLNWENPKNYYGEEYSNALYPYFSNNGYSLENEVPVFLLSENNTEFSSVKVTNLVWEPISKSALKDTPFFSIPTEEEIISRVVKARNQNNLIVKITAFKRDNTTAYRLKSFDIKKGNTPNFETRGVISDFGDSVLKSGTYSKISVDTTGIYKIDYDFLQSNGLNPSSINPSKIKVYGNGGAMLSEKIDDFVFYDLQENAIKVIGGDDGSFDNGDYILFYAKGPQTIKRNGSSQPLHQVNLYDDKAYYFIRFDGADGKRITDATTPQASSYITEYDDIRWTEPELQNVNQVGRIWLGKDFNTEANRSYSFDNITELNSNSPIKCLVSIYSKNAVGQGVNVSVNSSPIITSNINSNLSFANNAYFGTTSSGGSILNVSIDVDTGPNPGGESWFNFVELWFLQNLKFNGSQFNFRKFSVQNNGSVYGFRINNANSLQEVWNVSNWTQPVGIINQSGGGTFQFGYQSSNPDFPNEFVAFTHEAAYKPTFIGRITNQNIRGYSNIDYLIISGKNMLTAAEKLKSFHENENNYNVAIVTPEQIYNEFSSGSQDITAIRNYCRFLYKKDNRLKYLLLLGDASYDYKDRIAGNTNIVPSYASLNSTNLASSYVTDDYYAILDDGEVGLTSSQLDLAVGRIPADTEDEAIVGVNKALSYNNALPNQSSPFGIWRTKTKIVVDDDNPGDAFHNVVNSTVSSYMQTNQPQLNVRKLYLDAFKQETTSGGNRYPSVNEAIDNAVESGSLLVNYFGHGGPRSWTQERVLTEEQILSYNNKNSVFTRLPLFTTVTCDFSIWDNPQINSAGEYLVKTNSGGAVASITTSRAIGVFYGKVFNGILVKNLFSDGVNNKYKSFGNALKDSKIEYSTSENYKTNLLGDPANSLYRPLRKIRLNTINGEPANTYNGVFRALDFITIKGEVLDASGTSIDTNFNGKAEVELYDKMENKKTLNNDGFLGVLDYTEQNTRIYSGSTSVNNGSFTIEFYVPKDINYTVGNGKLVIYAENKKEDGLYYNDQIKVGDLNPDGINDDEPPVARLFMNNRHFANGGITNKDPIFIACVTDSTGINTTGIGVGHDITMVLDGNINKTKVLNSFYQGGEQIDCPNPSLRDFQKGMVTYNLKDLEKGEHEIKFKVWDINNNSTTETLKFLVVQEGEEGLVINRLLNWPNPFTDKTFFHFEHNCDEILEVQIQIFTISGKLVKTIQQQVTSEPYRRGYRTDKFGIPWDGLDDYGDKIGRGTYIFKATVKGSDTNKCKGTAIAREKLVILK